MKLTNRMANWISTLGAHIATTSKSGFPAVIVVNGTKVEGEKIVATLSERQLAQIENNINENPQVAVAPGQIGSIRAPYQFKGSAKIYGNELIISVTEIYCTKPGAEAGIRLDTLGYGEMQTFDESRWKDLVPKSAE